MGTMVSGFLFYESTGSSESIGRCLEAQEQWRPSNLCPNLALAARQEKRESILVALPQASLI